MTAAAERWGARLIVGLMLSALACGDTEPEARQRLLEEDFEAVCDDLPCGWSQLGGAPGQASYVETLHPGEHGLRLRGSEVSVRGPGGEPRGAAFTFSSLQVRMSAICDAGSSLLVRLAVTEARDAGGRSEAFDVLEGRVSPPADWSGPVMLTVTSSGALGDGGIATGTGAPLQVTGITITKDGGGDCLIDHLIVDDVGLADVDEVDDGCH